MPYGRRRRSRKGALKRKRTFRRKARRGGKRRSRNRRYGKNFPKLLRRQYMFNNTFLMATEPTAGFIGERSFRLNSPYDPDTKLGGSYPSYYSIDAANYNHVHTVFSTMSVEIRPLINNVTYQQPIRVGLLASDTIPGDLTGAPWWGHRRCQTKIIYQNGHSVARFRYTYSPKAWFNDSHKYSLVHPPTTNPLEQVYGTVVVDPINPLTTFMPCYVTVRIKFFVVFSEPRIMAFVPHVEVDDDEDEVHDEEGDQEVQTPVDAPPEEP